MDSDSEFLSIFDRHHDVVVVGAGLIGFATVRALFAAGYTVAWLHSGGDILWEISCALENDIGNPQPSSAWGNWLHAQLQPRGALRERWLEGAVAEAAAAQEILTWRNRVSVLLQAMPVAIEKSEGMLTALIVATKLGAHRVSGRRWIDTTEKGVLASLCQPGQLPPIFPDRQIARLIFQSLDPKAWKTQSENVATFCRANPPCEMTEGARQGERRLLFSSVGKSLEDFYLQVPNLVQRFRKAVPHESFLLSQCSSRFYPIYSSKGAKKDLSVPQNLLLGSPAWNGQSLATLADRFEAGHHLAAKIIRCAVWKGAKTVTASVEFPLPTAEQTTNILVVGAGTAGAVAAIAAARQGVETLTIEQAPFAGGIGSGGGISTYFHGQDGGLQEEIHARTRELSDLFGGITSNSSSWHHEARKIALAEFFRTTGVHFAGNTTLCATERGENGKLVSVLVAKEGRLLRHRAKTFIDSSGDGDLCAMAGVPFAMGRPGDDRTLAYSQAAYFLKQNSGRLEIGIINFDAGWVEPTDPEDLTRARLEGLAFHLHDDWVLADKPFALAPLLGVRQSRQIATETRLELADLIASARFPDAVGEASAILDNHSVDFEFESDEALFYFWVCRGFHQPLHVELPYRMLLPQGLTNVWVACRAAGISNDAAYCVRMQRDMQRLGEAAGTAAALAVKSHELNRAVNLEALRSLLRESGALSIENEQPILPNPEDLLAALDTGRAGLHLWFLAQNPSWREQVAERLVVSDKSAISFYAAAVLAIQGDARAEARLLTALKARELGESAEGLEGTGAFGQKTAIPFWLQAVVLLRLCGSETTLPALQNLAASNPPFNVLTMIALTLERMARRGLAREAIRPLWEILAADSGQRSGFLPPSRSLWRELEGIRGNGKNISWGVDTRQDHLWQLHLILTRMALNMGDTVPAWVAIYQKDARAFVRKAFAPFADQEKSNPPPRSFTMERSELGNFIGR